MTDATAVSTFREASTDAQIVAPAIRVMAALWGAALITGVLAGGLAGAVVAASAITVLVVWHLQRGGGLPHWTVGRWSLVAAGSGSG